MGAVPRCVGILDTNITKPTRGPNTNGFALQWDIGLGMAHGGLGVKRNTLFKELSIYFCKYESCV